MGAGASTGGAYGGGNRTENGNGAAAAGAAAKIDIFEGCPKFLVYNLPTNNLVDVPPACCLILGCENLLICSEQGREPIVQFPYFKILSWGSNSNSFQFRLGKGNDTKRTFAFQTNMGKHIEIQIMKQVRSLMSAMDTSAMSEKDYRELTNELRAEPQSAIEIVTAWLNPHKMTARQAIGVIELVRRHLDHFTQLDLATVLCEHLLQAETIQLVVNTFPSEALRENIKRRLAEQKGVKERKRMQALSSKSKTIM